MKVEIGVVYTRDAFSCLFRGVLMIEWSASNKAEFSFSYLIFLENQKISTKKKKHSKITLHLFD